MTEIKLNIQKSNYQLFICDYNFRSKIYNAKSMTVGYVQ